MSKKKTTAKKQTKPEAPAVKKPETLVYCGPTVRNVAKQFAVYNGDLPAALADFLSEHPAAKPLVVPVQQFAAMRRDVQATGTPQHTIYQSVFRDINGGK